jgi:predicted  nucleic acid-binding Zn-ribbon protein
MKQAYEDMKGLLRKSMDECVRLAGEISRLEKAAREDHNLHAAAQLRISELEEQVAEAREEARSARSALEEGRQEQQQEVRDTSHLPQHIYAEGRLSEGGLGVRLPWGIWRVASS